eukprot:CAMPEP_0172440982 /NCGR_PEP_ID=MMETSP1065-20121228/1578_1 /TAXON_ID=265537 /ORGANISM="Amphiprora paludosa, Strain CCMP125" /LENGTH=372 /DNA_ID=CAMNT_0013190113 /DNA_START=91 /DNA_END=1207 /DNA_ORIENTATION=-
MPRATIICQHRTGQPLWTSIRWHGSTSHCTSDDNPNPSSPSSPPPHQRVWVAGEPASGSFWQDRVVDQPEEDYLLQQIDRQERDGGRMRHKQQGVLHEDPVIDMRLMTQNYTVASLASALRDREEALQQAAVLAEDPTKQDELQAFLKIFHPHNVLKRRQQKVPDLTQQLDPHALEWLRKTLTRMPRSVVSAHEKRAAVVLPLCTIQGVPCLLLEKRAPHLRAHPDEVCLPGGMYCQVEDKSIVQTCLREMREEIGGLEATTDANNHVLQVLGVFRINWGQVHHLVGVAVTPVVCYLGELPSHLYPNAEEVSQIFTISLESLADPELWIVHKENLAPQFVGGPHAIFGLTGYILDRFRKDILYGINDPPNRT